MNWEVPAECPNPKKQEGGGVGSFYNLLYSFLLSGDVAEWREWFFQTPVSEMASQAVYSQLFCHDSCTRHDQLYPGQEVTCNLSPTSWPLEKMSQMTRFPVFLRMGRRIIPLTPNDWGEHNVQSYKSSFQRADCDISNAFYNGSSVCECLSDLFLQGPGAQVKKNKTEKCIQQLTFNLGRGESPE